jgi:hypothetical protein
MSIRRQWLPDVSRHVGSVWQDRNGNRNVPYLNRNGSKRNLNLNWFDDKWNADYRFAAIPTTLSVLSLKPASLVGGRMFVAAYSNHRASGQFHPILGKALDISCCLRL